MTDQRAKSKLGSQLLALAAMTLAVGVFLPWARLIAPFVGTVSISGIEGDGVFVLALAAVIAVLAYLSFSRALKTWEVTAAALAALAAGAIVYSVGERIQTIPSGGSGSGVIRLDTGYYLCLAGSVIGVAASIALYRKRELATGDGARPDARPVQPSDGGFVVPASAAEARFGRADLEDLERLAALHDRGVLTDEEFQARKRDILSRGDRTAEPAALVVSSSSTHARDLDTGTAATPPPASTSRSLRLPWGAERQRRGVLFAAAAACVAIGLTGLAGAGLAVASALASERAAAKQQTIPAPTASSPPINAPTTPAPDASSPSTNAPTTNASVTPASCDTMLLQARSGNVCGIRILLEAGAPATRVSLDRVVSGTDITDTLSIYQSRVGGGEQSRAGGGEERLWSDTAKAELKYGGDAFADVRSVNVGPGQMSLVYVVQHCGANCGASTVVALAVVGGALREVLKENFAGVVKIASDGTSLRVMGSYWGPNDPRCCPSGTTTVTYAWNGRGYVAR